MIESTVKRNLREIWGNLVWDGQFASGDYVGYCVQINTDWLGEGMTKITVEHPCLGIPWKTTIHSDSRVASLEMQTLIAN